MILDEVGRYLAAVGALGLYRNLNLFEGLMPKDPQICTALLHVPGETDVRVFAPGETGISFEQPYFQVQVRAETYAIAIEKLRAIKAVLNGVGNTKIPDASGTLYGSILAIGNIQSWVLDLDQDLVDGIVCSQVFQVRKKVSAA